MIALTDEQLQLLMTMASTLPVNLRDDVLRSVADQLKVRTIDVAHAGRRALSYLQVSAGK